MEMTATVRETARPPDTAGEAMWIAPLAAIRFDHGSDVDSILEAVVISARSRNLDVCGTLQQEELPNGDCCRTTYLEDLASGVRHRISQPLGRGSRGCRLDPVAMAEVCGLLLTALDRKPDLVVINRFGKGEADGQGFRRVFEKAYMLGVPVLTAVRDAHQEAWEDFTDGDAVLLPQEEEPAQIWAETVTGRVRA